MTDANESVASSSGDERTGPPKYSPNTVHKIEVGRKKVWLRHPACFHAARQLNCCCAHQFAQWSASHSMRKMGTPGSLNSSASSMSNMSQFSVGTPGSQGAPSPMLMQATTTPTNDPAVKFVSPVSL